MWKETALINSAADIKFLKFLRDEPHCKPRQAGLGARNAAGHKYISMFEVRTTDVRSNADASQVSEFMPPKAVLRTNCTTEVRRLRTKRTTEL